MYRARRAIDIEGIACVLPLAVGGGRMAAEIVYMGGERRRVAVRPETVVRWVAESYCVDFDRARRRAGVECCIVRGGPVPISPANTFLPFHTAGVAGEYAYCNVAGQDVEVAAREDGAVLRLPSGEEIEAAWSRATLRHHLALAVDAHHRLLLRTLREMPPLVLATA